MTSCGQTQGKDSRTPQAINLEFSEKYDLDHAQHYFKKHRASFSRRLTTWRELAIARRALTLAGDPGVVLDLPCGAGRFWPMLAEKPDRKILAADSSKEMLQVAAQMQPGDLVQRVERFQCSAFEIGLGDGSVDNIFCMRLLHHIIEPSHRLAMLREFHRVTRDSVCLSLWVDGNYQAYRRAKLETRRSKAGPQNRAVVKRQTVESEFKQAGFRIKGHFDFLRFYSMWRIYVLHKEQDLKPYCVVSDSDRELLEYNGFGSFESLWDAKLDWFEEPNYRRRGWSGVSQHALKRPDGGSLAVFIKRQENHNFKSFLHPMRGLPTTYREYRNICKLKEYGIPCSDLVFYGHRNNGGQWQAILMTRSLTEYKPLEDSLDSIAQDDAGARRALLASVAQTLSRVHGHHLRHSCLYAKHIFVRAGSRGNSNREGTPEFDSVLIDLEKMRLGFPLFRLVLHDLDTLYRHWDRKQGTGRRSLRATWLVWSRGP